MFGGVPPRHVRFDTPLKATIPGKLGISAPLNGTLFHCHMHLHETITNQWSCTRVVPSVCHCMRCKAHAATDRGDHPGAGPWVCDGLMQMHMAMKQHSI